MRMNNIIILITMVSFCQISCGGSTSENAKGESLATVVKAEQVDPDARGENKCLLSYSEKLDQLLTPELAAGFAELAVSSGKVKYSRVMKNPAYHSVKYLWESDRKRNMKDIGIDMEVPVKNQIELHGVKESTLKNFRMSHRVPTAEELKQRDKAINDAIDGKSGNRDINEKLEKLDKMKVEKSTQKGATQNLGNTFAKVAMAYEDISGLGDAASWNSFERRLYVIDSGVEISVSVDLSYDEAVNKEKAIVILKKLLAVCD